IWNKKKRDEIYFKDFRRYRLLWAYFNWSKMINSKTVESCFDNTIKALLCLFFLTCTVSISLSEIGFFGAFFVWLVKMVYFGKFEWKRTPADLPFLIFTLLTLFAVYIGVDKASELTNRLKPLSLMFIYPLVLNNLKSRKAAKEFLLLMLGSILIQSAIIIYYGFSTSNFSQGYGVGGTMSVTLTAGEMLATILGFALCFLVSVKDKKVRMFSAITFIAGSIALLFTLARGAWVSFFFLFLAGIIVFSAGGYFVKGNVFLKKAESTFNTTQGTTPIRFAMWRGGLLMLKDNPFGIGIDNVYKNFEKPKYKLSNPGYPIFGHLHNNYLQLAVERGILALIAFLWLFYVFIRTSIAGYLKEKDKEPKFIYLGIMLAFLAFMIGGMFEYGLGSAIYAAIIWALAAMGMTLKSITEK